LGESKEEAHAVWITVGITVESPDSESMYVGGMSATLHLCFCLPLGCTYLFTSTEPLTPTGKVS